LLIKSGTLSLDPSLPDMQFVRTMAGSGATVFIPGSSLKGVFRSFSEKVLRTLYQDWACDPLSTSSCGKKLQDEKDTAKVYRESCCACRLYGNTRLKGRVAFTDAFPEGEVKTEVRFGVAISRLSNAVAHGPFDMEIVVAALFRGHLTLENFTVGQLGLLALTVYALNEGLIKIGFGKNRGFGEVSLTVRQATLDLVKTPAGIPPDQLWGVGCFVTGQERETYKLQPNDFLEGLPPSSGAADLAVLVRRVYDAEEWQAIAEKALAHLSTAVEVPG
jgi:CRISPR-associated RAMP protein (TIGR02581 family)